MNDMEEGIRRFNIVLGLDTKNEKGQMCMDQYFSKKDKVEVVAAASDAAAAGVGFKEGRAKATDGMNSNPHPKVRVIHNPICYYTWNIGCSSHFIAELFPSDQGGQSRVRTTC